MVMTEPEADAIWSLDTINKIIKIIGNPIAFVSDS
ncbi:hypothetical protein B6N60_03943 [Richelia sinica FACHB-800]|uniref:Uncharacterized protein n=1 Tax=Richelia sinica FACHB-800 TaxID=1357546 RepID=A0A975Y6G4_9NOST|nr:hypothetical protein B6N60_03943 [Richelia sinica FACHB-800]